MAALLAAPPRTPSPKIKIHRSQSFDSPSSRMSVTPIEDSPYSKSASDIIEKPLPRYNALKEAEQAMMRRNNVMLHTKLSDDSIMSDASSSASSSVESSPTDSESGFGLFGSGSPNLADRASLRDSNSRFNTTPEPLPGPPEILESSLQIYQDMSSPMYDPWLVRVVLDLYDVRGFDWMMIAEPIERVWGFRTSSAEVLGILSGNGRVVGRRWWD